MATASIPRPSVLPERYDDQSGQSRSKKTNHALENLGQHIHVLVTETLIRESFREHGILENLRDQTPLGSFATVQDLQKSFSECLLALVGFIDNLAINLEVERSIIYKCVLGSFKSLVAACPRKPSDWGGFMREWKEDWTEDQLNETIAELWPNAPDNAPDTTTAYLSPAATPTKPKRTTCHTPNQKRLGARSTITSRRIKELSQTAEGQRKLAETQMVIQEHHQTNAKRPLKQRELMKKQVNRTLKGVS